MPTTRQRKAEQLLSAAGVAATWGSPPSAEAIRAADRDTLLNDPMLVEVAGEEDEALAAALLEASGPEKVALALIRLHRSRLPEPEDVYDPGPANVRGPKPARGGDRYERESRGERSYEREERGDRPPPRERRDYSENMGNVGGGEGGSGGSDAPWFRLSVGRNSNADPKWLIPLICRLGHVTKNDIGSIKIFDRETKFEIDPRMAERFYAAVCAHPDDAMRIEPASNPGDARAAPRGKPRSDGPRREDPPRGGPRGDSRGANRDEGRGPRSSPFAPAGGGRDDGPRHDRPRSDGPRNEGPRPEGPRRGPKNEPYKGGAPKTGKRSNASNASGDGGGFGGAGGGPPSFAKKQYTKKPRK